MNYDPELVESPWTNIPLADRGTWFGGEIGRLDGIPFFHLPQLPEGVVVVVDSGAISDVFILPTEVDIEYSVDVYPVGVLKILQMTAACIRWRHWDMARGHLRSMLRTLWRHLSTRNWRALKNDFNGYLCELTPWPEGAPRCGSGWTRRRALRSMYKLLK